MSNSLLRGRPLHYRFDDEGNVVPCRNIIEWSIWSETHDRRVELTVIGNINISTVLLTHDHNYWGEGPPILFETMVWITVPDSGHNYGREWLDGQQRYSTIEEARQGHALLVEAVKERMAADFILEAYDADNEP